MAFPGRRRPISESVRNRPELRYRCENLIDLKMEVLGSTTKTYKKPTVPAALREVCLYFYVFSLFYHQILSYYLFKVLNSALKKEPDLEIKKPMTARRRPTTAHHKTQGVR